MLTVFTRAIIVYIFLLIAMRLMGKKQLGELQPFEFAISLIVADLACIPMSDTSIPISYGLVPIFTLFVLHLLVTKIVKHSIKIRGLINGKPIIVINPDGIDYSMLKKLDMNMNDLMESLRGAGYFSPSEVEYAIVETNGNLSVLPKSSNSNEKDTPCLPYTLICEGKLLRNNVDKAGLDKNVVSQILDRASCKRRDILLLTIDKDNIFIQPKLKHAITMSTKEVGL